MATIGSVEIELNARVQQFTRAMGQAEQSVKGFSRSTQNQMAQVESSMRRTGRFIEQTLAVAVGVNLSQAFARLTSSIKDYTVGSAQLYGRVRQIDSVLEMMGERLGYSASQMDRFVEGVKAMGITTQVAQSTIQDFIRYEIDLAKATELARMAQDAAIMTGEDSSATLQRLMWGITTYQTEVLRTAGIQVQFGQAFEEYAESVGKSADELTNTERTQAALNAVLAEGAAIAGSYERSMKEPAKALTSVRRYMEELRVEIGERLYPVYEMIIMEGIIPFTKWLQKSGAESNYFTDSIAEVSKQIAGWLRSMISWVQDNSDLLLGLVKDLMQVVKAVVEVGEALVRTFGPVVLGALRAAAEAFGLVADHAELVKVAVLALVALKAAQWIEGFAGGIDSAADAFSAYGDQAATLQPAIEHMSWLHRTAAEAIGAYRRAIIDGTTAMQAYGAAAKSVLLAVKPLAIAVGVAYAGWQLYNATIGRAAKEKKKLQSAIEAVSEALVTEEGVLDRSTEAMREMIETTEDFQHIASLAAEVQLTAMEWEAFNQAVARGDRIAAAALLGIEALGDKFWLLGHQAQQAVLEVDRLIASLGQDVQTDISGWFEEARNYTTLLPQIQGGIEEAFTAAGQGVNFSGFWSAVVAEAEAQMAAGQWDVMTDAMVSALQTRLSQLSGPVAQEILVFLQTLGLEVDRVGQAAADAFGEWHAEEGKVLEGLLAINAAIEVYNERTAEMRGEIENVQEIQRRQAAAFEELVEIGVDWRDTLADMEDSYESTTSILDRYTGQINEQSRLLGELAQRTSTAATESERIQEGLLAEYGYRQAAANMLITQAQNSGAYSAAMREEIIVATGLRETVAQLLAGYQSLPASVVTQILADPTQAANVIAQYAKWLRKMGQKAGKWGGPATEFYQDAAEADAAARDIRAAANTYGDLNRVIGGVGGPGSSGSTGSSGGPAAAAAEEEAYQAVLEDFFDLVSRGMKVVNDLTDARRALTEATWAAEDAQRVYNERMSELKEVEQAARARTFTREQTRELRSQELSISRLEGRIESLRRAQEELTDAKIAETRAEMERAMWEQMRVTGSELVAIEEAEKALARMQRLNRAGIVSSNYVLAAEEALVDAREASTATSITQADIEREIGDLQRQRKETAMELEIAIIDLGLAQEQYNDTLQRYNDFDRTLVEVERERERAQWELEDATRNLIEAQWDLETANRAVAESWRAVSAAAFTGNLTTGGISAAETAAGNFAADLNNWWLTITQGRIGIDWFKDLQAAAETQRQYLALDATGRQMLLDFLYKGPHPESPLARGLDARVLYGFAKGGLVRKPTLGILGEAGPELVTPLRDVGMMGSISITVNTGVGDPVRIGDEIIEVLRQAGYAGVAPSSGWIH